MNDLNLIKGIGPKTKSYLEKLEVYSMNDLIHHYPFRYEILKRSDIFSINQDDMLKMDGIVDSIPSLFRFKRNMNKMTFRIRTKETLINVVIFNRGFLKQSLSLNKEITVIGKWDLVKNTIIASDILFEGLGDNVRIEAIYHTTSGVSRKNLRRYIDDALKLTKEVIDYIPNPIINKYNFIDKRESLDIIHHPIDINLVKKALLRLKYEELFMYMVKMNILKNRHQEHIEGHSKKIDNDLIKDFILK